MAKFTYEIIKSHNDGINVDTTRTVVKCVFDNTPKNSTPYHNMAKKLAEQVNPNMANDSNNTRNYETLLIDTFAGLLAEYAYLHYIRNVFGEIVNFTEYKKNTPQIDLLLSDNKTTIEVRSSFPKKGIKFAICNKKHGFKNVGAYTNLYKSNEPMKDLFLSVLFETQKEDLLKQEEIILYLVGGSTREMMLSDIAFDDTLKPKDNFYKITSETKYRTIYLYNTLDIVGLEEYICSLGYQKINSLDWC